MNDKPVSTDVSSGRRPTVVALCALVLSACTGADAPSWAGSVDTLANGTVLVLNPAGGALGRLVETRRIGAVDGGGPDQFGRVLDATLDDFGRLYVLEGQAKEVRIFDSHGRHVRTLARPGTGPGELRRPLALEWGPLGRLWIVDFGNRRYEVFDTAGAYVASHRLMEGSFGFSNRWGHAELPLDRFTLTDRREGVAVGMLRGPLDVPYVVIQAVEHAGGAVEH